MSLTSLRDESVTCQSKKAHRVAQKIICYCCSVEICFVEFGQRGFVQQCLNFFLIPQMFFSAFLYLLNEQIGKSLLVDMLYVFR